MMGEDIKKFGVPSTKSKTKEKKKREENKIKLNEKFYVSKLK